MNNLPKHLGGHKGRTHVDQGTLEYLKNKFNIKTMLDIGCGPGGMIKLARENNIEACGIDGDFIVERDITPSWITIHDYTVGPSLFNTTVDLIWSVEFLEHVNEEYQDNYMQDFAKGKYALITFAPPGKKGHHHVNCRDSNYWISVFDRYGFSYDSIITKQVREVTTMNVKENTIFNRKAWVQNNGLFFIKQ
jgi:cyclopropane fatty-acyl-phospholipid synthase-like methyltransferase